MYAKQSDGTISRKFVKKMTQKFEDLGNSMSYEANFQQCNWWLDTPASDHCFDDLSPDTPPENEQFSHTINNDEIKHTIAIDRAEIADEVQGMDNQAVNKMQETSNHIANDVQETNNQITDGVQETENQTVDETNRTTIEEESTSCLHFPSETTNVPNEETR